MIYCFICDNCGHTAERQMPASKSKKRIACEQCQKYMRRDLIAEHGGFRDTTACWPMESDAAGVHPAQVAEAMEHDRRNGVPTDYTKDGNPIFTSREHRNRYCQANGLYDRNAGYGDRSPKHNMTKDREKRRIDRIKRRIAHRKRAG